MKKIIALDIDGTLLNSNNEISDKTLKSLLKAQDMGHILVIASGRNPQGVEKFAHMLNFKDHNGLLSNFNGGMITNYKTGEVIIEHTLDYKLAKDILQFSENLDINYFIYGKDELLTNSKDTYFLKESEARAFTTCRVVEDLSYSLDFAPHKILFSMDPRYIDKDAKLIRKKFIDRTDQVKSTPFYYEVMPKGINKGKSLLEIANYYKVDIKDTIAFGDEENDLSMIELAGIGVVMGNGTDFMKSKADFVTKSNDQDGISFYLENYLF
ncbi:MAG: Cof-type HAD-IIB family hydrolase [Peptoniphilaceae bacterium]|nr:Cof-type HAD-IIB family hydrolase [Peptoniphilaceae bacterium]MDY6018098.1 Cof-type HAD-IIB family hydrolase [Anaerococcus sp.]